MKINAVIELLKNADSEIHEAHPMLDNQSSVAELAINKIEELETAIRETIGFIEDTNALKEQDGGESLRLLKCVLDKQEVCFANKGDSESNMQADLEQDQLELDAARWNAFINSPFRLLGYAGLEHNDATQPCPKRGQEGFAHFGCEMWTKHSGWEAGAGKDVLIGFADQAIRVQAKAEQN